MAIESVGYYALPIIPSFKGLEGNVNNKLGRALDPAGAKAGKGFASAAGKAIARDHSIEDATKTKAKAAEGLAKAMDKAADAAGKMRVAEAALNSVRGSGNTDRVLAAEERLASARRRVASSTREVTSANNALASSQTKLENAIKTTTGPGGALAQAGESGGGGGAGGTGLLGLALLGRSGIPGISSLAGSAGTIAGTAMKAGIVGAVGVGLAAAVAAPFIAAWKAFDWAAEVGLPFEQTLNTFKGVTNATKSQVTAVHDVARQLGADTQLAGVTATDAALAMTELAKAGFTVDEAMTASRGTLQLATAAQISAADAALYQSSAINTFGLNAGDAARVANDLAAAAAASSIDVPDLGLAMQQSGAVARGFGMSLEDTIATLSTFAQMGVRGSDAGTLMKTSLLATLSPTEKQSVAMEGLNLHLTDANDNFVGYREMMRQLSVASKSMGQATFDAAAAQIFGSDAVRASMFAANDAVPIWDRMREAQEDQGAAARMAAANMQGLPGVMEAAGNTIDDIKLTIYEAGNAIAVALGTNAVGALSTFGAWFRDHTPEVIGFFTWIGTEALAGMAQVASAVETGADALAGLVNVVGDTMGGVVKALATVDRFIHGSTENNRQMFATAETLFGLGDGLESISKAAGTAENKLTDMQNNLQTAGDQANTAAKFTRDLGDAVAQVSESGDTIIHEPTPEQLASIDAAKYKVEAIPGTKDVTVVALTDEALEAMNAWRKQQDEKPIVPPVKPKIAEGDTAMRGWFDKWSKEIIAPSINPVPPAQNPLAAFAPGGDNGPVTAEGLGGLTPGAVALSARYAANFGLKTISGWRPKVNSWDEHQTGKAIDIGIPDYSSAAGIARGNAVLADALSMPQVKHVIWRQAIYDQGGGSHMMTDRGDATQNHFDHVHILLRRAGGGIPGSGFGDKVPVLAEPGEHMFDRGDVAAMGGQQAVYDFRRSLHRQAGGGIFGTGAIIWPREEVTKTDKSRPGGVPDLSPGIGGSIGLPDWSTPGQKFGAPPADWWDKPVNRDDILFPEWMPPGQRGNWLDQWGDKRKRWHPLAQRRQGGGEIFPWDEVAKAESGGNWANADSGHNGHYGGLQFSPATWLAFGGGEFAPMPHQASREQQIVVADRTAFTGYKGNAPQGLGAWEVITKGLVPNVTTATGRGAPPTGGAGGPAGSALGTAGVGPNGTMGTYAAADPDQVRDAQQRVADADQNIREKDARVREEEASLRELAADAKESERIRAQNQLDSARADAEKARREKTDAETKLGEVQRGKFTEGKTDTGTGEGDSQLGELGSIAKQFLSDTFGFGDLIPDPSELGIVKLASAIMGIKYTPQGKGFPWQTGYPGGTGEPWSGDPFAATGTEGLGGAADFLGGLIPGVTIPPPPEGNQHMPGGAPAGVPVAPGPVDQSTNVTINNPQGTPESNEARLRRTLLNTPRLGTYSAPAAGTGP